MKQKIHSITKHMMNWTKAKELLTNKIYVGLDLDPQHTYKIITDCGTNGFTIQVGTDKEVNVSYEELEKIFEKSKLNDGVYKNSIVKELDSKKLLGTPCLVQAVGKMFAIAGVMNQKSPQIYEVVKLDNFSA